MMAPTGSASASATWRSVIDQFLRHAVHQVAALDLHDAAFAVFRRAGGADFLLDALGRAFADQQVMVAADIGDDGLVHLVAADAHRARIDDAAEAEARPLRVVPPPISTTIEPVGSVTGRPAPIAAAIGSSIR